MSKKIVLWLAALLLMVGGVAGWLGHRDNTFVSAVLHHDWLGGRVTGLSGARSGMQEIPEIPLPPEGLNSVTYTHARQIIEMARSFTDTQRDLAALQAGLAAQRAALAKKED